MYDVATRGRALQLIAAGASLNATSKQTGIGRSTLREWRESPERAIIAATSSTCCRCREAPRAPEDLDAYRHLLGLYLGDGCLSRAANKDVWALRIACDDNWPGLQDQCESTIARVLPGNRVGQSDGKITAIEEGKISLIEIVTDGVGGFIERPAAIALSE